MRTAILTDIHANREALAACLAYAARTGADRYAFLGDLVGYGADPAWVLDTVMRHVAAGAIAVLGNHDAAVLHGPAKTMRPAAQRVAAWTRAQLSGEQLAFLSRLPLAVEERDTLYVHANAWAPGEWSYVHSVMEAKRSMLATRCRYTLCGHVHDAALYHLDAGGRVQHFAPQRDIAIPLGTRRQWLAIAGAVGQPRDGVPAARYAMFDDGHQTLTFHRVPYDFETAAAKITAAGLPQTFVVLTDRNGDAAT